MRELLGEIIDAGYFDVARRISDIWSYPECPAYLYKLLLQDRVGRRGFPPIVISAIMELQQLRVIGQQQNIWDNSK